MRPSPQAIFAVLYLLVQFTVPFARMHPGVSPPFAPRFSWSMFAGPLTAHCAQRLVYTHRDGSPATLPLPATDHPAYALLVARTPGDFARASQVLIPYASSDEAVADAVGDFLRRYRTVVDPARNHTLVSTLDCKSPIAPAVHRVLHLEAAP